jgi:hypothetical protein
VPFEIQPLAFVVTVPDRELEVFPTPPALGHTGARAGRILAGGAQTAAREWYDHGHHENKDVVGIAEVGHGEREFIGV